MVKGEPTVKENTSRAAVTYKQMARWAVTVVILFAASILGYVVNSQDELESMQIETTTNLNHLIMTVAVMAEHQTLWETQTEAEIKRLNDAQKEIMNQVREIQRQLR